MFQDDIRDESMQPRILPVATFIQNDPVTHHRRWPHQISYASGDTVPSIVSLFQVIDDVQVASSESHMELLHLV